MKRLILPLFILALTVSSVFAQVNITFELNTATIGTIDPGGLFIAGGSGFGFPGDNQLTDPDGDGVYSITLQRDQGFSSHYTFLNGNCSAWDCKENLANLPCADPGNFNDRFLPAVMSDTTVLACFGTCDSDGSCTIVTDSIQITFELNTANIMVDPGGIFIAGGGNFGNPGDNPTIDPDGDGIYTYTTTRPLGFASHYTFLNGNCSAWDCKEDLAGLPCGDPDNFNDRFLSSTMSDTTILACFGNCASDGSCDAVSVDGLIIDVNLFTLRPTIVNDYTNITFNETVLNQKKQIILMNAIGETVYNSTSQGDSIYQVNTERFSSGIYYLSVKTDGTMLTKKFIIQK